MEYLSGERFSLLNPGEFSGWAVTWKTKIETWVPTRFWPGSFAETLKDRTRGVKLTWMHDMADLVGLPVELEERTKGLWLHGKLTMTRTMQFDRLPLIQSGVIDSLSIGWNPLTWDMEDDKTVDGGQIRNIRKAELIEIGLVGLGADPKALIEDVATLRSHQPRHYSVAEMQRIVAGYRRDQQPARMAAPVRPLFPAQGSIRPESDSEYGQRITRSMEILLKHEAEEARYRRARHHHAMALEGFRRAQRAMGY